MPSFFPALVLCALLAVITSSLAVGPESVWNLGPETSSKISCEKGTHLVGAFCVPDVDCRSKDVHSCSKHGVCNDDNGYPKCICNPGFTSVGVRVWRKYKRVPVKSWLPLWVPSMRCACTLDLDIHRDTLRAVAIPCVHFGDSSMKSPTQSISIDITHPFHFPHAFHGPSHLFECDLLSAIVSSST